MSMPPAAPSWPCAWITRAARFFCCPPDGEGSLLLALRERTDPESEERDHRRTTPPGRASVPRARPERRDAPGDQQGCEIGNREDRDAAGRRRRGPAVRRAGRSAAPRRLPDDGPTGGGR